MSTSYACVLPQLHASVQPDTPTSFQCRHIFTDGHRCGSPTLRKENFCYYHHGSRQAVRRRELEARKAHLEGRSPQQAVFDLPAELADRSGLQQAIADVLQRIARNEIDPRRAGLLLYGLQIASLTLPRLQPVSATPATTVEDVELDAELGPLAPVAELIQPGEQKDDIQQLLEEIEREEAERREAKRRQLDREAQERYERYGIHAIPPETQQPEPPDSEPQPPIVLPLLQAVAAGGSGGQMPVRRRNTPMTTAPTMGPATGIAA